ncbi:hypothetical protein OG203_11400 [Nocardia sp. NBC_01499]|uniref:hypothetical protein n=1 Tax=Nocardia sp. NBC_01499 TaxID=2903597 RepID=UPI00386A6C5B
MRFAVLPSDACARDMWRRHQVVADPFRSTPRVWLLSSGSVGAAVLTRLSPDRYTTGADLAIAISGYVR